jgi:uncharacterized membrane protein
VSPGALAAEFAVPFYGALLCVAPAVTKPTVQFGVRIPPERTGATVIGDQRRVYFWRTAIIGVKLPGRLTDGFGAWAAPGHRVPKTPVTAFALVFAQLWVTALWTAMMLIIYRSRPDIEAADPAASVRRYRRFLARCTTAMLALVTLIDLSLLLDALRNWQVYRLAGAAAALPLLPYVVGLLVFLTLILRSGQSGFRLAADGVDGGPPDSAKRAGLADRDDDRFWKGGLIYVNRDDPALMIGARFGVGWTFNLANPAAWLLLSAIAGVPAGLVIIAVLTR